MADSNLSAPYAPVSNVLAVIRRLRERGLPDPLTLQELERIGIPSGNAPRTLAALRFLGLVDEEGHRTAAFERIGRASTDEYESVLAEVIRAAYADVFTVIDPAKDTDIAINDAFRHYAPQAQRSRMITLFLALSQEAGIVPGGPPRRKARVHRTPSEPRSRGGNGAHSQTTRPEPVETRVPAPEIVRGEETDYRLISALMQQLPANGKWTQSKRDRWIQAVTAAVDLLTDTTEAEGLFDSARGAQPRSSDTI